MRICYQVSICTQRQTTHKAARAWDKFQSEKSEAGYKGDTLERAATLQLLRLLFLLLAARPGAGVGGAALLQLRAWVGAWRSLRMRSRAVTTAASVQPAA